MSCPHRAEGIQPVQPGHLDIQENQVRPHSLYQLDCFQSIGGLTDNFQVGFLAQQANQSRTRGGLIVGNEDFHFTPSVSNGRKIMARVPTGGRGSRTNPACS
ncbi:hypothetical protein AW736_09190 [Termitidicoccus mucosus]|uniref:Uncharacterized protein n=1 Tax=Termitidicoccus mucosus TaxID=1184151 RepID=A0A178IIC1_9BACT|nr:hypothetical protein AW736_09190 [Opitutaceae bacterium TSB47]